MAKPLISVVRVVIAGDGGGAEFSCDRMQFLR